MGRYVYPAFRTNSTDDRPEQTNGVVVGVGLRCGAQIRVPNGVAGASSSGDGRAPDRAFDGDPATFWRNRTRQSGPQYLEMDFAGAEHTVTKVSLPFGSHHPAAYELRFRIDGHWVTSTRVEGNTWQRRAHVWFTPLRRVQAVRLYALAYSGDDYFSVHDMAIQR